METPDNHQVSRRRHTKSRAGCVECKKRKIKCDEVHPRCRKCTAGGRECRYAANRTIPRTTPRRSRSAEAPSHETRRETPILPNTVNNGISPTTTITPASQDSQPVFTALHMHLLYHASTRMDSFMALDGGGSHTMIASALDHASTVPFLLDQLLALAALHRSATECDDNFIFRHEAAELQTRALGNFNQVSANLTADMGIATFVYVSLLGIHILHDTLAGPPQAIGGFISNFVSYMRIHRGVRVVTKDHWTQIYDAELQPLLHVVDWIRRAESSKSGPETSQLHNMLVALQDGPTWSIEASLEALGWVQWVLNLKSTVPEDCTRRIHATMAWPLVVPERYVDSLHQRRPEAIAVLAFFAAMLHQRPHFWGFADAGPQVVRSIIDHVGPFWEAALAWPQQVTAQL